MGEFYLTLLVYVVGLQTRTVSQTMSTSQTKEESDPSEVEDKPTLGWSDYRGPPASKVRDDKSPDSRHGDRQDIGSIVERSNPTDHPDFELARTAGNGVRSWSEDMSDMTSYSPNDGRSKTNTTFNPFDADVAENERQSDWTRRAKLNDGVGEPDRAQKNRQADRKRWVQTFCSQIEVPEWVSERVVEIALKMKFNPYAGAGMAVEQVLLALISLVYDKEVDPDSIDEWIIYRDEFDQLMTDLEMDRSDLWTALKLLSKHCWAFQDDVDSPVSQ